MAFGDDDTEAAIDRYYPVSAIVAAHYVTERVDSFEYLKPLLALLI